MNYDRLASQSPRAVCLVRGEQHAKVVSLSLQRLGIQPVVAQNSEDFQLECLRFEPSLLIVRINEETLQEDMSFILSIVFLMKKKMASVPPILVIAESLAKDAMEALLKNGVADILPNSMDLRLFASKLSRFVTTEAISAAQSNLYELANRKKFAGKLSLSCDFSEVNEEGIVLRSDCFLPKGTVLTLKTSWLSSFGAPNSALFTVRKAEWEEEVGGGSFRVCARLDPDDLEMRFALKRWMATH